MSLNNRKEFTKLKKSGYYKRLKKVSNFNQENSINCNLNFII